ncbi:MAG TPA: toxic anion resistance protein [Candidatus Nanoarchaeia archaeon]|nr:hypothetical protein [uncultured archaeon]
MTHQPTQPEIQVSPHFAATIPAEPKPTAQVAELSALSVSPEKREMLVCRQLLKGDTLVRAQTEAADVLPKMLSNTQVLAVFGNDALESVNRLTDRMLDERPPVDVPELREVMRDLSRRMRGIGRKYDPSDEKALEKYKKAKGRFLGLFRLGRTFLEEFLDDIRSLQGQCDWVIERLDGKQNQLLRNVTFYDEYYKLNETEIDKLIYKIGVMEIIRDMAAEQANRIVVGDSNLGDRSGEEQARISELVTLLENKIIAFKGRLWVAWAMAPQTRNMRVIQVGLSARIDQTVDITIPTMKGTILIWLTLGDAEQAQQFNAAVEDTYNQVLTLFANAAKATVPAIANALVTPALDPRTVVAWTESLVAQADGFIQAIELGQQKRAELEQAMINGKQVIDEATQRVNQAQIEHVLELARQAAQETPLQIARSVPAAQS